MGLGLQVGLVVAVYPTYVDAIGNTKHVNSGPKMHRMPATTRTRKYATRSAPVSESFLTRSATTSACFVAGRNAKNNGVAT